MLHLAKIVNLAASMRGGIHPLAPAADVSFKEPKNPTQGNNSRLPFRVLYFTERVNMCGTVHPQECQDPEMSGTMF
eukprot:m.53054 g.53054  ORF g.53054 m.53054 type:complete len:76 (-) comp9138_c0_seq1:1655-1882(-)